MSKPLFSILHSTARPGKWREAYIQWVQKAAHPEQIEYILCVDDRWGFPPEGTVIETPEVHLRGGNGAETHIIWNKGPKTAVSGWNTAGAAATGDILLVVADDFFPCLRWDAKILCALDEDYHDGDTSKLVIDGDFAIRVSDGTPADEQGHICHAFLSRARLKHQGGFVYHPEYDGVFCDNDFTAHARQDRVIIDATHLKFEHRHAGYQMSGGFSRANKGLDDAWWHHNKPEDYVKGRAIFERRKRECFGHPELVAERTRASVPSTAERPRIALCLPGETFNADWVAAAFRLNAHIANAGYPCSIHMAHTTNVYVTRADLLAGVKAQELRPDFVLWIDDDNALAPEQFDRLMQDLEAHPEADGVAGWCWIQDQGKATMYPSCGLFSGNGLTWQPFNAQTFPQETEPRVIDVTGFPVFLMRWSAIEKAGENPFLPLLDPRLQYGLCGEDHAFCRMAKERGGAVFLADPQVRVPHLKYRAIEPAWVVEPKDPVIVGMMRVKNEERWIERSVTSLLQVCSQVYVLDDASTDDTRALAQRAGAIVIDSPWGVPGQVLDESRDKNWLLDIATDSGISPVDYVFCIDGDEELAPDSRGKILAALKARPDIDCWGLKFLHLWDRTDQIRVDRWYSQFTRRSIFKPKAGLRFQSLYAKSGVNVHSGLHTGNAPGGADASLALMPGVFLIHYGYMVQADRIRKWKRYNELDPNNELEDCYRHCVQGDVPEVPAAALLRHAGPLQLAPLPKGLARKPIAAARDEKGDAAGKFTENSDARSNRMKEESVMSG